MDEKVNLLAIEGLEEDDASSEDKSRMLAVRHVAKLLGIHESTVRMWADRGVLPSYRIGPRQDRRIPLEAVNAMLEAAKRRTNSASWITPSKPRE